MFIVLTIKHKLRWVPLVCHMSWWHSRQHSHCWFTHPDLVLSGRGVSQPGKCTHPDSPCSTEGARSWQLHVRGTRRPCQGHPRLMSGAPNEAFQEHDLKGEKELVYTTICVSLLPNNTACTQLDVNAKLNVTAPVLTWLHVISRWRIVDCSNTE